MPVLYSHNHLTITSTKPGTAFLLWFWFLDSAPGPEVMQRAQLRKRLNIGGCYSSPSDIFTVGAELRCLFWIYAGCLRGGRALKEKFPSGMLLPLLVVLLFIW